jgi:hypothetical protein
MLFGGGPYSTAGSMQARMVGKRRWPITKVRVNRPKGGKTVGGVYRNHWADPYLSEGFDGGLHPGGNSVCYQIQIAHLMGCDPIYLLGFTLANGSTYFFGRENPVEKRPPLYEVDRAMVWLKWYEEQYPGRVRLIPGWDGPITEVFEVDRDG